MRILIAEDDLTTRTILMGNLQKWGYEVVAVKDGLSAWDVLRQPGSPSLVILDWIMPGMDGVEVIQKVRAMHLEHPPYIILLTGRNDTPDIITGLETGANDYIKKPFENEELFARLRVGQRMLDLQLHLAESVKVRSMAIMAAGIAHEVNSPLQVVTLILDKLLNQNLILENPVLYRDIQALQQNSWRIAQITRALLTYIQVVPMKKNRQNLNDFINNFLSSYSTQVPPNVIIRTDLAPNLPLFSCDVESFQQALIHLLKNAFDAMQDEGEVLIQTACDVKNEKLILRISDTCKDGIPEDIQRQIFDPFFTTKLQGKGMGIGLSIVRGIVKAHQGEISFQSSPGIGTTFSLVFPYGNEISLSPF